MDEFGKILSYSMAGDFSVMEVNESEGIDSIKGCTEVFAGEGT